ncbi:UxaA family hydrolase, partial [Ilumatobacter sp.]|uniref:UxaA family hydrolase n=1 Tax=Ilumatobacter sp. TaxID=1967498 RepID=UPI003AF9C8D6
MSVQFLKTPALRLHPADDVVIALRDIAAGAAVDVDGERMIANVAIPAGHKMAVRNLTRGDAVHRYAQVIGSATSDIAAGDHVHGHNLAVGEIELEHQVGVGYTPTVPAVERATFRGIRRSDGRIATRNYLAVIATVNCSATVARAIAAEITSSGALDAFPNVDGLVALTHGSGCGMDSSGEGLDVLRRTIAGYATHPNFSGVLLVGLGCEANGLGALITARRLDLGPRLAALNIQEIGGTRHCVDAGVRLLTDMLPAADEVERSPIDASELVVGLQCGGSDGYSGITANPALGAAVDLLVAHGGTAILSETPEIYGAEHLLTRRAASQEVARKLLDRIAWWEDYTARNHGEMDNNPSPGNKAGGLTTIYEKSLGAVAKGGSTGLMDVYRYADAVTERGFVFMDTPGYDPVSVTGQVAGGANLVCFTTGRGSAYGCIPSPSIKLATNSGLYERQADDIDVNCGEMLDLDISAAEMGRRIFD